MDRRGAWRPKSVGSPRVRHDWVAKQNTTYERSTTFSSSLLWPFPPRNPESHMRQRSLCYKNNPGLFQEPHSSHTQGWTISQPSLCPLHMHQTRGRQVALRVQRTPIDCSELQTQTRGQTGSIGDSKQGRNHKLRFEKHNDSSFNSSDWKSAGRCHWAFLPPPQGIPVETWERPGMQKGWSRPEKGPGYHLSHLNSLVGKLIRKGSFSHKQWCPGTSSQKPIVRYSEICKLLVKPWQLKIWHNGTIYTMVTGKHKKIKSLLSLSPPSSCFFFPSTRLVASGRKATQMT